MSQIAETSSQASSIPALFPIIEDDLSRVEKILSDELSSDIPFVDELLRYGSLLGGKRLRPALLLLTGKVAGELTTEHYTLGAVVEMIHTATLVHDDVLDEADTRRHISTVNARWNNSTSVLLGDYLFTHAFYLASTLDSALACQIIGRSTNVVCEGELRQIGTCGDYSLSEDEYLRIIDAKTAELCACSCRLGAVYSGADERTVEQLAQYGRALGLAFQITDDILDLLGDEDDMGKSLGTDLEKQKPTLPLIHALASASPSERNQVVQLLHESTGINGDSPIGTELAKLFQAHDAFGYAKQRAAEYAAEALERLIDLGTGPELNILRQLTTSVLQRTR